MANDNAPFGFPGRLKTQTFTVVTTTISANEAAGQTILSVNSTAGMSTTSGKNGIRIYLDDFTYHQSTIVSIGAGTVTIANALPSQASSGLPVVAAGNYTWDIPAAALESGVFYATYCGGGQGGAGGHATGGAGGGGGASCTFRDIPIYVDTAGNLTVSVGIGGAGGAVGAVGVAGTLTRIDAGTATLPFALSTGRCATNAGSLPQPGGAADGGKGGDGAPLTAGLLVAATATAGVESGPLGGVAGTGATNGRAGVAAFPRGYYGTTGGAGGGGGSTASKGGAGGADDKHGDQLSSNGVASGGAGGGSMLGGAAYGGDPADDPFGVDGNGPGAGGGGGGTAGGGGKGGEGIVILRWA